MIALSSSPACFEGISINGTLGLYSLRAYTPIMKGILIAFSVPTCRNKTKSSDIVKAFYGQETSAHNGKYKYHRNGILDEIPHNKLIRGVIIVKSNEAKQVIEFLEKQSAQYHIRVVELSKEDCTALGLSTE